MTGRRRGPWPPSVMMVSGTGATIAGREDRLRSVTVTWDSTEERFTASGTHRGHTIGINAPHEPGSHHSPTGFSATELLLAAAGSCSAWDVVEILRKQRQDVSGIEVRVDGEQEEDPPWRYLWIGLHYTVRGRGLSPEAVGRSVRLSIDGYCSVLATVREAADIEHTVEIVEEPVAIPG